MSSIGSRISSARKAIGMTQEELAHRLGYKSKSSINKIELGINDLTPSKVMAIANILGTTPSYLMGWLDEESEKKCASKCVRIPIIGRVAGGEPILMVEDIEGYEEIPERLANNGNYVAMRIHGESMSPRICDGDLVIVREQQDADDGQIVIAAVNGDDATCKKIRRRNGQVCLMSFNPAYPPQWYLPDEVTIKGLVVELRAKM